MGHGKLENVLIEKKGSRKDCFNKRNRGILKKLYQLAYISGCGVHLVIQAEDGNIYEFHRKMNPVLQKTILQASLLNSSSMKNSSSSSSSSSSLCPNPLISKVVNVSDTRNSTSSMPRPSKITNKRMFFNGVKTMDTGLTISPQERVAMMNPSSCSCFDCQKGFSSRFVECIDPTSYMEQPFINHIQCPSLHGHDDLITHPINQHSSHIDQDISKLPFTYTSPTYPHYNPRNFMSQFATPSPHLGGLLPPVTMAAHDALEDHCELEFEQSDITKCDQQNEEQLVQCRDDGMENSLAPIVELPNISHDNIMMSTNLPTNASLTLSEEFLADGTCFEGTDTSFTSEMDTFESYFGFNPFNDFVNASDYLHFHNHTKEEVQGGISKLP